MPIHSGESLENPATGTRVVWRRTSLETGGLAVVVEVFLEPNGYVPPLHVHPRQLERVEVLAGSLGTRVGRRHAVVGPGARLAIAAGVRHRFWNAGTDTAQLMVEVTPALEYESLLRTTFALAAAGRTNARGLPAPLLLAAVAADHFDTVRLPFPPPSLQRLGLALAAPLGRALARRYAVTSKTGSSGRVP